MVNSIFREKARNHTHSTTTYNVHCLWSSRKHNLRRNQKKHVTTFESVALLFLSPRENQFFTTIDNLFRVSSCVACSNWKRCGFPTHSHMFLCFEKRVSNVVFVEHSFIQIFCKVKEIIRAFQFRCYKHNFYSSVVLCNFD